MTEHPDVPVRFGTSSLRGSATYLTAHFVNVHVRAFLTTICGFSDDVGDNAGKTVFVAMDRRASSPRIAADALRSIHQLGGQPIFFGHIPTPALAAYGLAHKVPSLMVTASHNPAPHNGIKFFTQTGELLHDAQANMLANVATARTELPDQDPAPLPRPEPDAGMAYIHRYVQGFEGKPLTGLNLGFDLHSAAGKDLLIPIFQALGATCTTIRNCDGFIAIDTENLSSDTRALHKSAATSGHFDAIISTDGDGDRPLLTDETGQQIHGDQIGILAARYLGAKTVVTPISATTALELSGWFNEVKRTKIGSPHILSALKPLVSLPSADHLAPAVAFEPNGGFVLAQDVCLPGLRLAALPTRDALLPIIMVLRAAVRNQQTLSQLKASLPQRFVAAGSLTDVTMRTAQNLIANLLEHIQENPASHPGLAKNFGVITDIDTLDGLRLRDAHGRIIHIRPSGNAPELRIYVETEADQLSHTLLAEAKKRLKTLSDFSGEN